MANAKGSNAYFALQEEATFGVSPVSPDLTKIYFNSENVSASEGLEESKALRGNRNPAMPVLDGAIVVGGGLVAELSPYQGKLWKGLLGSVTDTGSSSPYTHTIKIGSSLPSFVGERGHTDISQYVLWNGLKLNKASLSVGNKGIVPVTFDLLGAKETLSGTSFDATQTDLGHYPFSAHYLGTMEEGGSAIAIVTGIDSLSIENNLDGELGRALAQSGVLQDLPEGTVKVSGTVKAMFANLTLLNKAINSTESSLKFSYKFGDGLGTAGNESIEFFLAELKYQRKTPAVQGPQGVYVELPFVAYYDNAAGVSAIQITIKNTQATL